MKKAVLFSLGVLILSITFAAVEYGNESTELEEPFPISLEKTVILDSGYELPVIVPVDNRSIVIPMNETVAIVVPLYDGRPALMRYFLLGKVDRALKDEYKNIPKKWEYPRVIRVSYNNQTKWFLLRLIRVLPHGQELGNELQYYDSAYVKNGTLIVTIPALDNEPVIIPVVNDGPIIIPLDNQGPGMIIRDGKTYLFDNAIETDDSVLLKRKSPPVLVPIYDTSHMAWEEYTKEIASI